MSLPATVASAVNLYHPAHSGDTPLDTLLVVIGCVVALLLMAIPAAMSRSSEDRRLAAADDGEPPA